MLHFADQEHVFRDDQLPIKWRLMCGGVSGAVAQSGM